MSGTKTVGLTIDGRAVRVPEGASVLGAAEGAGIAIPHFCYHPAFAAEGSCRMCLVEIEGLPKLELSCSTAVREGLVVRTNTERVARARRDVLELLLAEHPLDCPVCDKAGECRLQDYYEAYGPFPSRFAEPKEKRDKIVRIGRGLVLDRERCILCTRCVRFLRRITGTGELGVFERGVRAEIGAYDGAPVETAYAGNLVDLCPVGAITSEDFRFKTRAWFLRRGATVCPGCGRGCAVVVESVAGYPLGPGARRVYRVRAGENPAVNGHWICDLGRAGRREIDENRLGGSAVKGGRDGGTSWQTVVADLAAAILAVPVPGRSSAVAVVLNSRLTSEELALAKRIFVDGLGLDRVFFADPKPGEADGFLLTADRTPNARGASQAGFSPRPPELGDLAAPVRVLIVFGPHLLERFGAGELAAALAGVPAKYLFSSHAGPLDGMADAVVAVAVPAEKSGSFVNTAGLRQAFGRALEPPPGVVAEGEALVRLARGLGLAAEGSDAR